MRFLILYSFGHEVRSNFNAKAAKGSFIVVPYITKSRIMTKSEKKVQLNKMITEFLAAKDPMTLTRLRNLIYMELIALPMSSNDKNALEDAMYLWNYNSDRYIENPKSITVRTTLMSDFASIVKTVDTSLLKN